ncbi:hypothetical protein ACLOJK_028978 [Asimina triloba]
MARGGLSCLNRRSTIWGFTAVLKMGSAAGQVVDRTVDDASAGRHGDRKTADLVGHLFWWSCLCCRLDGRMRTRSAGTGVAADGVELLAMGGHGSSLGRWWSTGFWCSGGLL